MDINETTKQMKSRHPWELSRTRCMLEVMEPYLIKLHTGGRKKYLNIGAGDLYYDYALMEKWNEDHLYAVDIGYQNLERGGVK